MHVLFAVDRPNDWPLPLRVPGAEVVDARAYVEDPKFAGLSYSLVFNLCRSYSYQRLGYYVSLLGEARGHRVWPSIGTIADFNSQLVTRAVATELQEEIDRALRPLKADEFVLSIYFGRPLAQRYARIARALSTQFDAPLLRARFVRQAGRWELRHVGPIPIDEVAASHFSFIVEAAQAWVGSRRRGPTKTRNWRAHLAILIDPEEKTPPSDERALKRFERAARKRDVRTERITRHDIARLEGFDALFIRTTTNVGEYTHRFARRAEAAGTIVIDDPTSIVRCTNKVYLAELLTHHQVPAPRTMIVHRGNRDRVATDLGLPCVLKEPDSAFSAGVSKARDAAELTAALDRLFEESELIIAQEFVPTDFDWRVGILGGEPLYACRYFMAPKHWQIIKRASTGRTTTGKVETIPLEDVPPAVLRHASHAASLIGDGLYGVDLKQHGKRVRVIEVNDNPNLDAGYEDKVLGDELYLRIVDYFLDRIEAQRSSRAR